MKKLIAVLVIAAAMASCNNSSESKETKDSTVITPSTDSITLGADSIQRAADTAGTRDTGR